MITEDFIDFETAKLLKEKGFDGPCYKVWESHGKSSTLVSASCFVEGETVVNKKLVDTAAKLYAYEYSLNNKVEGYLAPTLQMVMKWLREEHNICIQLTFHQNIKKEWGWYFMYFVMGTNSLKNCVREFGLSKTYSSYEEACEAAIKCCLENLI